MKVADLVEQRRMNWRTLEKLCDRMVLGPSLAADELAQFAALYRAACADRALADAYHLPPNLIDYLDRLVGRAHNLLYRSRKLEWRTWYRKLLVEAPRTIFQDRCVRVCFGLFWGVFAMTVLLARSQSVWPNFVEDLLTLEHVTQMEEDFAEPLGGLTGGQNVARAGFYIRHNTSIGLRCFALGILVIPGLLITMHNAAAIGAAFGYMWRPEVAAGENFFDFVTAHAPFELTAIVLAAGAGLRLGVSWMRTDGWVRGDSLRRSAVKTLPIVGASAVLFFLAALIEGFVSPTAAPYGWKMGIAVVSTSMLFFYFIILGYPRRRA